MSLLSQWKFFFDKKPIPIRHHDWEAVHNEYDGAPDANDDRYVTAGSLEAVIELAQEVEAELLAGPYSTSLMKADAASEIRDMQLKDSGFAGSAEKVNANVYGPSEEYPAPWRCTRSPEGICSIYAANNARVCEWINQQTAEAILREVNDG